jgi:integrase
VYERRHGAKPKQGEKDTRPVHLWVEYYHRGRQYRESAHSDKPSVAAKLLKRRLRETGNGTFAGPDAEKVTFEQLAAGLVNDYRVNGRRSLKRAELSIKHLRVAFGLRRAVDITRSKMDAYVAGRLTGGAKPATVQAEIAALRRMFSLGVRAGLLPTRPAFDNLKFDNTRTRSFTDAELELVLDVLERGRPATAKDAELLPQPDLVAVVSFAAATGWRVPSEVLPLQWAQVDLAAGTVSLARGTTKSGQPRVFPFSALPHLATLLREQREKTSALERQRGVIVPHVFHRAGRPIQDMYDPWRAACKAAEVPGRFLHDLRRTAARGLRALGLSDRDICELCGWETQVMVGRYLGRDPAGVADRLRAKVSESETRTRTFRARSEESAQAEQGGRTA